VSSRAVLDYLVRLAFCPEDWEITLLHILRKPTASEELMGKKFTRELPSRFMSMLEKAKANLIEHGFNPNNIEIIMDTNTYETVADGIIEQCKKKSYDMVVIGRKRMSKAEEFVLGDVSIKLIRVLQGMAVLVVKSD